jgi:soluble lytic murein transglycosylase-like protein
MTGSASARSHAYPHRHYRFARRHGMPLHKRELAASYRHGFQPFAGRNDWRQQDGVTDNRRLADNRWAQNGFGRWQSGGWSAQGAFGGSSEVSGMAAQQASAAGIPVSLVERVIKRESGGNPRAVSRGNYGLMQIRLGTARAMGYSGSAAGLLDAQTNMTYAVRYLAGAYRAAGGNESRAVALYARGYYGVAKAQGFSPYGRSYEMASNTYGAPASGYQPAEWQTERPYTAAPRYRTRRDWHRPA